MPFALVIIGLILIVSGARNTYQQLGAQLVSDFTGPGNFTYWLVAIGAVGSIGYVKALRSVSHLFLALVVITMVLKNGGIFDKITSFLKSGPIAPTAAPSQSSGSGLTQAVESNATIQIPATNNAPSGSSFLQGAEGLASAAALFL